MQPVSKRFEAPVGGRPMIIETGKLAGQAGGAVTVQYGDSMVFAAATMSPEAKEGQDFFPLTVEYEERMYAGGRIPGSFFRREGRPNEEAILVARLTDRSIRPLFSSDMRNEVQVFIYSFSADLENPLDVLAVNAASASLMISDIPWAGPVGAVRVGRINGEFIANPTFAQIDESDLDLRMAGNRDAILMVECGANEVPEDVMVQALLFGHQALQPILTLQEQLRAETGKPKSEVPLFPLDQSLADQIFAGYHSAMEAELAKGLSKHELDDAIDALRDRAVSELAGDDEEQTEKVKSAFEDAYRRVVRARILNQGIRPDGRKPTEIRPIWCEVGISPRAHGSGLFTRGETQVLTLATLGTPHEAMELDSLSPAESKRYIHHYNFPPFSTGEVKPIRGQSRREVGHGALAERALVPVIPPESSFPYTIRLVSEVLSSNGSTSMASVCGSTLALMDTGVPIRAPVAGVAMGLIKEGDQYVVLTDIQGAEDHLGDMDFKVAGTAQGITALQMDMKVQGISADILRQALNQAHEARIFILGKILAVIPEPRPALKPHVPRITTIQVPTDKIGAVIGPGGKTIRTIQEQTGAHIDVEEDGTIYIASADEESARKAQETIESLTEVPALGTIYTGRVVRTTDYGAFIEILPNVVGMAHISQLDTQRVEKVSDVVNVGDEVTVMVTGIDDQGKIRLSRQAVMEGLSLEEAQRMDQKPSRGSGRPSSSDRRGSSRDRHDDYGSSRDGSRGRGPRTNR
jgi:polyribonucleotide nucleotidyltransferase